MNFVINRLYILLILIFELDISYYSKKLQKIYISKQKPIIKCISFETTITIIGSSANLVNYK
jgi:hypothetical protein